MAEVAKTGTRDQTRPMTSDSSYEDPYKHAITYLEQHNILQIFQTMTARIIYLKPDNPLDFMITEIGEMKKQRKEAK